MSQYSIMAAHRITGHSRTTITKDLKKGKLSYTTDANGNKLIDASELIRVYGDACNFDTEEGGKAAARMPAAATGTGQGADTGLLEKEQEERRRERQQFEAQIEHLKEALRLAQEGHNRATLLLESQAKSPEGFQQQLVTLEQRLADNEKMTRQQIELVKERAKVWAAKYRMKLETERKKSFWHKLVGRM